MIMINNSGSKVDYKVYPFFFTCLCSQNAIYFQFLRPLIGSYFTLFTQVIKTVLKEQYLLVLEEKSTCDISEVTPLSRASGILILFYFRYKQYVLKRVSARKRQLAANSHRWPSSLKSLVRARVLNTWKQSPEFFRTSLTWAWAPRDILEAHSLSCVFCGYMTISWVFTNLGLVVLSL